jgi:hypothetical protein
MLEKRRQAAALQVADPDTPPGFFVSVASKGLKHCASPLFATHTRRPQVLHLKDLCCTKIVHILRGVDGHRRGQELAAIVPRSYYTRGIWARQEELARGRVAATRGAEASGCSRCWCPEFSRGGSARAAALYFLLLPPDPLGRGRRFVGSDELCVVLGCSGGSVL